MRTHKHRITFSSIMLKSIIGFSVLILALVSVAVSAAGFVATEAIQMGAAGFGGLLGALLATRE